mmetsp:Transcript_26932/g.59608  ORF Transcript_26932/g.59608 Transcript_26932/m.59608 type:complete len:611 (-) Transcript_26932:210-2042(-)
MEQQAWNVVGLAAGIGGMVQSRKLHKVELEHSVERHKESVSLAKEQHDNDMKTTKQTYLLELFNSLEQHFQQLNADLIASSRESERDMFDQRNQSFQTIILASSVMFAALSSIIVDGTLPVDTNAWLMVSYGLTSSLSFAFLFLSIVFCIELVIRTSQFMYKRGKAHTESLKSAIKDTKLMMRELRGDGDYRKQHPSNTGLSGIAQGSSSDSVGAGTKAGAEQSTQTDADIGAAAGLGGMGKRPPLAREYSAISVGGVTKEAKAIRRAISSMGAGQIEEEFERHEVEIRNYLRKREELNDAAALTSYKDGATGVKRPFKHFWVNACEKWWNLSILLFYGGSLNMLLTLMIYMWAQFLIQYNSMLAAIVGVSLIGTVVVVSFGTVLLMRDVDRRADRTDGAELHRIGAPSSSSDNTPPAVEEDEGQGEGEGPGAGVPGLQRVAPFTQGAGDWAGAEAWSSEGKGPPQEEQGGGLMSTPAKRAATLRGHTELERDSTKRLDGPSFESHLRPRPQDVETGRLSMDSSVNSDLSLPPDMRVQHVYNGTPSPRRRFLASLGSSIRKYRQPSPATPASRASQISQASLSQARRQPQHFVFPPSENSSSDLEGGIDF